MATSPLFGWEEPDDVDLVKDGAAAIRTLGNAIDTSMGDLLGGTTGQILAKNSATNMDFTWITNDVGDITAVTVTSPITGGGTSGSVGIAIQDASTAQRGSVQLSDSTSTTSSVLASTPTATKAAYDLAAAAIAKTTVTTAGDLIYRNATVPVRLGIGTAGQVLTVNSGATAPEWATPSTPSNLFYAGKNKIINGDFGVWQRGTTFTPSATGFFLFADRFRSYTYSASATTASQQTFTAGTAPVSGYEGTYFGRVLSTNTFAYFSYNGIENVRNFAGQTVTLSYWAKSASGQTLNEVQVAQYFGSTGSAAVNTNLTAPTITTSWARYTHTFTMPSISGKTIGGGNDAIFINMKGAINNALDLWGFQLEAGSTATDFQTASGSLQGELALCQRYFISNSQVITWQGNTTNGQLYIQTVTFPVQMRVAPTITQTSYAASNFNTATLSAGTITVGGFLSNETATATASGAYYQATYTANAEL
jgi:hypothetical protein